MLSAFVARADGAVQACDDFRLKLVEELPSDESSLAKDLLHHKPKVIAEQGIVVKMKSCEYDARPVDVGFDFSIWEDERTSILATQWNFWA